MYCVQQMTRRMLQHGPLLLLRVARVLLLLQQPGASLQHSSSDGWEHIVAWLARSTAF